MIRVALRPLVLKFYAPITKTSLSALSPACSAVFLGLEFEYSESIIIITVVQNWIYNILFLIVQGVGVSCCLLKSLVVMGPLIGVICWAQIWGIQASAGGRQEARAGIILLRLSRFSLSVGCDDFSLREIRRCLRFERIRIVKLMESIQGLEPWPRSLIVRQLLCLLLFLQYGWC